MNPLGTGGFPFVTTVTSMTDNRQPVMGLDCARRWRNGATARCTGPTLRPPSAPQLHRRCNARRFQRPGIAHDFRPFERRDVAKNCPESRRKHRSLEMSSTITPRLLSEKDAASYCGVTVRWLRDRRWRGTPEGCAPGPAVTLLGRLVRYDVQDLDSWIEARPRRRS